MLVQRTTAQAEYEAWSLGGNRRQHVPCCCCHSLSRGTGPGRPFQQRQGRAGRLWRCMLVLWTTAQAEYEAC